jgi:hypothetical protein
MGVICPECGAEYRRGFERCSDCGIALNIVDESPLDRREKEWKKSHIAIEVLLWLIVIGGWILKFIPTIVVIIVTALLAGFFGIDLLGGKKKSKN